MPLFSFRFQPLTRKKRKPNIQLLATFFFLQLFTSILGQASHIAPLSDPVSSDETTPNQYHIQTDDGSNRFFKYQTLGGQFRKETRLDDGTVVGTYGWVDANDVLRLWDYVADNKGYRVVNTRSFKVGKDKQTKLENLGGGKPHQPTKAPFKPTLIPTRAGPLVVPFQKVRPLDNSFQKEREILTNEITAPPTRHPRLQRRIESPSGNSLTNVVPLFDLGPPLPLPTTPRPRPPPPQQQPISRQTQRKHKKRVRIGPPRPRGSDRQPRLKKVPKRGRGHPNSIRSGGREKKIRGRGNNSKGRFFVVKRRRKPKKALVDDNDTTVNYQTDKFFHKEKVFRDLHRMGEYGYIDPLGIRRVVTYSTGPGDNGIEREKENDFVGEQTYFEAS